MSDFVPLVLIVALVAGLMAWFVVARRRGLDRWIHVVGALLGDRFDPALSFATTSYAIAVHEESGAIAYADRARSLLLASDDLLEVVVEDINASLGVARLRIVLRDPRLPAASIEGSGGPIRTMGARLTAMMQAARTARVVAGVEEANHNPESRASGGSILGSSTPAGPAPSVSMLGSCATHREDVLVASIDGLAAAVTELAAALRASPSGRPAKSGAEGRPTLETGGPAATTLAGAGDRDAATILPVPEHRNG